MQKNFWTILVAVLLVLILILYAVTHTVQEGRAAVVRTFGAISRVQDRAGLLWRWPWPVQSVSTVDTRLRILEVPGWEVLTSDQYNVLASLAVEWRIEEPGAFWTAFQGSEQRAEDALANTVRNARREILNQTALLSLVTTETGQAGAFGDFEVEILQRIREDLDSAAYGIRVRTIRMTGLAFPDDVTEQVAERMIRERDRLTEQNLALGRREAENIVTEAEGERARILAEAEAEATAIRGEGDAAAAEFYGVFSENPELAVFLRKTEALRDLLTRQATLVLTTGDSPFDILSQEPPAPEVPAAPEPRGTE
jgi:membrane protease subunit HflC